MEQNFISYQECLHILLLSLPLVVGGILHMVAVKRNVLSYFNKPIHQSMFGQNKTWRGFIVMPLAIFPGVVLAAQLEQLFEMNGQVFAQNPLWLFSLLLGMGYCLAELPNSFIKRRLAIKEGQTAAGSLKWIFVIIDQADSAFGCMAAYKLIAPISWGIFWKTIIFGTLLHLMINILLFKVKIRKNPF